MATTKKKAAKKKAPSKPAKKKPEVNKTEEIRNILENDPKAKPTEIATILAKRGIKVTAGYVSTIKTALKKKKGSSKKARKSATAKSSGDHVSLQQLLEAKKFADKIGSVDEAGKLLQALGKLG